MDDKKLQDDLKDSAHKIWLAGLGALAAAEQEGTKMFNRLVDRGREVESRGKVDFKEQVGQAKAKVDETVDLWSAKLDETITLLRNGFSRSVTQACNGCVVTGSSSPTMAAIVEHQPAVELTTVPACTVPWFVSTDCTRPWLVLIALTRVNG